MSNEPGHLPKRGQAREQLKGVEVRKLGEAKTQSLKRDFPAAPQAGSSGTVRNRISNSSQHPAKHKETAKMSAASVIAYGILACLILLGAVWFMIKKEQRTGGTTKRTTLTVQRELESTDPDTVSIENGLALEDIAQLTKKTVKGLLSSKTVEERIPFLRPVPGLRERMEDYYAREGVPVPDGSEILLSIDAVSFAETPMRVVKTLNEETEQLFPWTMIPSRESMLVDWDSSVAYGEMEWSKFIEIRPEKTTQLRVFLANDNYYNFEFSDDKKYLCFLVSARFSENPLYGYVERGSDIAAALKKAVIGDQSFPVNVRLRFPNGSAGRNQVHIEELIHLYWLDMSTLEHLKPSEE